MQFSSKFLTLIIKMYLISIKTHCLTLLYCLYFTQSHCFIYIRSWLWIILSDLEIIVKYISIVVSNLRSISCSKKKVNLNFSQYTKIVDCLLFDDWIRSKRERGRNTWLKMISYDFCLELMMIFWFKISNFTSTKICTKNTF